MRGDVIFIVHAVALRAGLQKNLIVVNVGITQPLSQTECFSMHTATLFVKL